MKVILKREVDNLGLPGDVVEIADGYGRNYLIPRGMAILATRGAMKEAEALTRSRKASEAKTLGSAQAAKEALEARALRIAARVDEHGSLYGSVSAVDVHRVLKERGHDVERKRVELKGGIKEIGTYEVPVRVHPQVTATVVVEVVDVEGKVGQRAPAEEPATDVTDTTGAEEAAAADTDLDALAEQALEAAGALEAEESATGDDDADTGEDAVASDDAETP